MISVSENFLAEQSNICPFLRQGICICVVHFFMKHCWTNCFNVFYLSVGKTSVDGRTLFCLFLYFGQLRMSLIYKVWTFQSAKRTNRFGSSCVFLIFVS